jgi:hypothetical protein
VDRACSPFRHLKVKRVLKTENKCREDLHFFYSCKYNSITGAYHGKTELTLKEIMAIQIDLYDFHSDNIIGEVRKHLLEITCSSQDN